MKTRINNFMAKYPGALLLLIVLACIGSYALATDISFNNFTLVGQQGDTELVLLHKAQLSIEPKKYTDIATGTVTGTTSIACSSLDRLVIGTAGAAASKVIIEDGTIPISTASTASQATLTFNVAVTTGTLNLVYSGSTTADLTVGYR